MARTSTSLSSKNSLAKRSLTAARRLSPFLWVIWGSLLLLVLVYGWLAFVPRGDGPGANVDALPELSHPGGYYGEDIRLQLQLPPGLREGGGTKIIYTLDGSEPHYGDGSLKGHVYFRSIFLHASPPAVTVVRARLAAADGTTGPLVSASYFMGLHSEIPMLSLVTDPDNLWDPDRGIYLHPQERGSAWERPAHMTYVDTANEITLSAPAGLRIHGQFSRNYNKKSFRLYFRQEYGLSRLAAPLFDQGTTAQEPESFKRLVLHAGGQDASQLPTNWSLMRNQIMADLAQQTAAHATRSQPILLFLNGEPWGLYYIRERIDRFFLADRLGIAAADQLDTPARRSEVAEASGPGDDHWDNLTAFIATNDMADPLAYAFVQTQVDIDNFVDYSLLQLYSANFDWPFTNINQFRPAISGGRWQWVIWDSDLSLGLRPWSDVSMNTLDQALDPNYTAGTELPTDGRDTILLRALLGNPDFRSRFLSRAAWLLNGLLSTDSVLTVVDRRANAIMPGIGFEGQRWGSSVAEWEAHVEQIRQFARTRPDLLRQQFVETLQIPGLAHLNLAAPTHGQGSLALDGHLLPDLPWQGEFFATTPTELTAVPARGYRFSGWEGPEGQTDNPLVIHPEGEQVIKPRFERLNPGDPLPGDVTFEAYGIEAGDGADWLELRVNRPGGVDLRGWRITDNDHKTASDEGSLIFPNHAALADVAQGTVLRIVVTAEQRADDLSSLDGRLILHSSGDLIETDRDPGFNLGEADNLVLLAPGVTPAFADDRGVSFLAIGRSGVTPASFGVLGDGVQAQSAPGNES